MGAARFLVARAGGQERGARRLGLFAQRGHLCRPNIQGGYMQERAGKVKLTYKLKIQKWEKKRKKNTHMGKRAKMIQPSL